MRKLYRCCRDIYIETLGIELFNNIVRDEMVIQILEHLRCTKKAIVMYIVHVYCICCKKLKENFPKFI